MKRPLVIVISFLSMFVIFALLGFVMNEKNTVSTTDDTNNPIEDLIKSSLSIQYGESELALDTVFTDEFIDSIDYDSNFYKKKLAPYKIVATDYKLRKAEDNEYTVSISIEDKNGSYIQIIHFVKQEEGYFISNIEYDI